MVLGQGHGLKDMAQLDRAVEVRKLRHLPIVLDLTLIVAEQVVDLGVLPRPGGDCGALGRASPIWPTEETDRLSGLA